MKEDTGRDSYHCAGDQELASALRRLAVSENGFLFDPSTGNSFMVNTTGLLLLRCLQEDKTRAAIIAELTEEYEVTATRLEQDLLEFCTSLRKFLALQPEQS